MNTTDVIAVYRNRRTGQYRIQPYARLSNGSSQPFGDQVWLPMEITNEELLTAVLDNLAKNNQQLYKKGLEPKITDAEWRRELREDQQIGIYRLANEFRIIPFRRKGSGFGSIDEMTSTVSSEEFLRRGGDIIRMLFDEIP